MQGVPVTDKSSFDRFPTQNGVPKSATQILSFLACL